MRTREQSLNNFSSLLDELISSNYLIAGSKLNSVINAVNNSKLLSDVFDYFCDGFDYEKELSSAFSLAYEKEGFKMPENPTVAIALVYLLLREIAYKRVQFTVILDCFCQDSNYDDGYHNFAQKVLVPFKELVYQLGMQIIANTQDESQVVVTNQPAVESAKSAIESAKSVEESAKSIEIEEKFTNLTLLRLIDLDKLAVTQSKISKENVEELLYVLDIFAQKVEEGSSEKIKLSYLAYYYALLPYKKIKSNVKSVTKILMDEKII